MFPIIPANKQSISQRKLAYGIGINDADYVVTPTIDTKQTICPFYRVWRSMLDRCYNAKKHKAKPTYKHCLAAKEWHLFLNFRRWMVLQAWQGNELDKDILVAGNKVYSPETCCFVSREINLLLTDHGAARGKCPIGVCYHKVSGRYMARLNINGSHKYLGLLTSPESAHTAFLVAKSDHVRDVAQTQREVIRTALFRIADLIESGNYYK